MRRVKKSKINYYVVSRVTSNPLPSTKTLRVTSYGFAALFYLKCHSNAKFPNVKNDELCCGPFGALSRYQYQHSKNGIQSYVPLRFPALNFHFQHSKLVLSRLHVQSDQSSLPIKRSKVPAWISMSSFESAFRSLENGKPEFKSGKRNEGRKHNVESTCSGPTLPV
jgi:hypothetical protein